MEALKLLKEEAARKRKALKEIGKVIAGWAKNCFGVH